MNITAILSFSLAAVLIFDMLHNQASDTRLYKLCLAWVVLSMIEGLIEIAHIHTFVYPIIIFISCITGILVIKEKLHTMLQ